MAHLGNNGALLGPRRISTVNNASGLWSLDEHKIAKLAGIWPEMPEIDPYWDNVSLLLHMDGSNGSSTFTDSSSNAFSITRNGSPEISTAQSKFGGASAYFNGSSSYYLNIPSDSAFAFGTGDFTVEAWVYQLAQTQYASLLEIGSHLYAPGILLAVGSYGFTAYSGAFYGNGGAATLNQWQHIAFSRSSGTLRIFVDGTVASTVSFSNNLTDTAGVTIGATPQGAPGNATVALEGYIDEFRVTKGVARYTATFTPPTAPFPDS